MTVLPHNHPLRETRVVDNEQFMRCSKCREWKGLDQFSPNKFTRSGYQSWCRACQKDANAIQSAKRKAKAAQKLAVQRSFSQKTPMSRKPKKTTGKPISVRKKAIPAMSEDKKKWMTLYREKHEADPVYVIAAWDICIFENGEVEVFRTAGYRCLFERHHPFRRIKWRILLYRYVTTALHVWLEANATKAREMGLLYDVALGELRNPSPHDPLDCLTEFEELKKRYT